MSIVSCDPEMWPCRPSSRFAARLAASAARCCTPTLDVCTITAALVAGQNKPGEVTHVGPVEDASHRRVAELGAEAA